MTAKMTSEWKFSRTCDNNNKMQIKIKILGNDHTTQIKNFVFETGDYSKNSLTYYKIRVHQFKSNSNRAYYVVKYGDDESLIECMLIISYGDIVVNNPNKNFSILYESFKDSQKSPTTLLSPLAHGTLAHFSYLLFKIEDFDDIISDPHSEINEGKFQSNGMIGFEVTISRTKFTKQIDGSTKLFGEKPFDSYPKKKKTRK